MQNPFIFSHIVTDSSFCQRDDLEVLKNYMQNSVNVVLFSKRRFGKSSLIHEIFKNHIDHKRYHTIYFDIFDISSASDFSYIFYKAVANSFQLNMQKMLTTLKNIFSKATFSATVTKNGEIEFKPTIANSISFEESIEDIFSNLNSYLAKQNKKAIIAIDEFQQIATIKDKNIEAILRKHIQLLDNISFVYSGSKKHMLTQIFTDYKRPFYAQASILELKAIDMDDFYSFVSEKFTQTNKSISKEAFELLYQKVEGESWLVQNICYHLWQKYDQVKIDQIEPIINEVVSMNDAIFKTLFDGFSNTQKIALKAIVKSDGKNLLSKEILNDFNTTKASMVSALKALLAKDIIDKSDDRYGINDKLFEMWIKNKGD